MTIYTSDGKPVRKAAGFVSQWLRVDKGGDAQAVSSVQLAPGEESQDVNHVNRRFTFADTKGFLFK